MRNSLYFLPLTALVAPAYAVDYLSIEQAQQILWGENAAFENRPMVLSDDQRDHIKKLAGTRQRQDVQPIWTVMQDGKHAGWFIVDDVVGKHEYITYAVAISLEGVVQGIEILSYRETHGGQVRQADWREHFEGKTLADPFKLNKDIPNISGATLSCRNLTDGVKRLLVMQQEYLQQRD